MHSVPRELLTIIFFLTRSWLFKETKKMRLFLSICSKICTLHFFFERIHRSSSGVYVSLYMQLFLHIMLTVHSCSASSVGTPVPADTLTLVLLTSTKWWTPASASKWRMGFNSAFKGLKGASCWSLYTINYDARSVWYEGWIQSSGNTVVTWRMCARWHYCRLYLIAEAQLQ
jgi:hypothetical protein